MFPPQQASCILSLLVSLSLPLLFAGSLGAHDTARDPATGQEALARILAGELPRLEPAAGFVPPAKGQIRLPDSALPRSLGGFRPGEELRPGPAPGTITRSPADGLSPRDVWTTLPGETGAVRLLHLDRGGAFDHRLIAATEGGDLWSVGPDGGARLIASLGGEITGLLALPADQPRYGPWAGELLVGFAAGEGLVAVARDGRTKLWPMPFPVTDLALVESDLLLHDRAGALAWSLPAAVRRALSGEVLIAPADGPVRHARWNAETGSFELQEISPDGRWQLPRGAGFLSGPILSIPEHVLTREDEPVAVPVLFEPGDAQIAGLAFSIDLDDCLTFDPTDSDGNGLPDSILFETSSASGTPRLAVRYDPEDLDGELDLAILDLSLPPRPIAGGELLQIVLTPKYPPPYGGVEEIPLGFSSEPSASFGSVDGSSVEGSTQDGSVLLISGRRGDCNSDHLVDAGDLVACVLEIFDGDGAYWLLTPEGGYPGSPVGCDANADLLVDAGDLACKLNLIFGGSCAGRAVTPTHAGPGAQLFIPDEILPRRSGFVAVPVFLRHSGEVNSLVFSIDYDHELLTLDPRDRDGDGIPDSLRLEVGPEVVPTVILDPEDRDGELDIVLLDFGRSLTAAGDKPIATLFFQTRPVDERIPAEVRFALDPSPSFGSLEGTSVAGSAEGGSVILGSRN